MKENHTDSVVPAHTDATKPVSLMCRVLAVSRSGYYAWRTRRPSARAQADDVLEQRIRTIHEGSRGTYGRPRVALLQGQAVPLGRFVPESCPSEPPNVLTLSPVRLTLPKRVPSHTYP